MDEYDWELWVMTWVATHPFTHRVDINLQCFMHKDYDVLCKVIKRLLDEGVLYEVDGRQYVHRFMRIRPI